MELEFYRQRFERYSDVKFRKTPFSGSPVVPCGQKNRRTDMTKLIAAFRSFANAPKKRLGCLATTFPNLLAAFFLKQKQTLIPVSEVTGHLADLRKVCLRYEPW